MNKFFFFFVVIVMCSVFGFCSFCLFKFLKPDFMVSFVTEVKPLQDDEITKLSELSKKFWPGYEPVYMQCSFGKKPKCIAMVNDKDQRPFRIGGSEFSELQDSIGGVWLTEDFIYLSGIVCNLQNRPQCQATGLVKKNIKELEDNMVRVSRSS